MPPVQIADLDDSRVADYRNVTDADLLARRGVFVAEGRPVVQRLIASGTHPVRSVLVTDTALRALGDALSGRDIPVYVCDPAVMRAIVGFNIHRGCLAIAGRLPDADAGGLLSSSRVVVVLEHIRDADNVGSIFRNAAALGADAVLLSPGCCDPLYRKAVRTSMGSVLTMPYAWLREWPDDLGRVRTAGFTTIAMTPAADATDIGAMPSPCGRLAILLGNEADGLSSAALAHADLSVRIPMRRHIDSLNVATAAAIALHRLSALSPR